MLKNTFKDQRGVAPVLELLLVVIVIGVLAFVGYRAYKSQSETGSQQTPTQQSQAYSRFRANGYSFEYPEGWEVDRQAKYVTSQDYEQAGPPQAWTVKSGTRLWHSGKGGVSSCDTEETEVMVGTTKAKQCFEEFRQGRYTWDAINTVFGSGKEAVVLSLSFKAGSKDDWASVNDRIVQSFKFE